MKKVLSIALLAIGMTANAQEKESYFSISLKTDGINAIVGSKPTENKPALDLLLQAHMVSNNFEIAAGYENFNKIGFERYSVDFGYHFPRYIKDVNITIVPSVGFSQINRYNLEIKSATGETLDKSSHIALQSNLSFRVKLSDKFLIDWTVNGLTRPDQKFLYPTDNPKSFVVSNFIGVHWVLKNY